MLKHFKSHSRQAGTGIDEREHDPQELTNILSNVKLPDHLRVGAIDALGKTGSSIAVGPLVSALDDRVFAIREHAITALGNIGDERAVEPLIKKLKSDDDFYIRKKAGYTLYTFLKHKDLNPDLREKIRSHWRSWYLL